jgi:hypothetical protein
VGNTFDEGHGFSRAVKTCLLDGFSSDGTFCKNCCLGQRPKLNEKAALYEGHGFSRAVKSPVLDGFSR